MARPSARSASGRVLTADELLARVVSASPKPLWNRFLEDVARDENLRGDLARFHATSRRGAPASELVRVLMGRREFPRILSSLTSTSGFRQAYDRLSRDRAVVRAVRIGAAEARVGPAEARRQGPPAAASGGALASASGGDAAPRDERRPRAGPQAGGYDVNARLAAIRGDVGQRDIMRYFPSAFASMPREEIGRLETVCFDFGFCDPVSACRVTDLWASCYQACHASGKCPAELLQRTEPRTPIVFQGR